MRESAGNDDGRQFRIQRPVCTTHRAFSAVLTELVFRQTFQRRPEGHRERCQRERAVHGPDGPAGQHNPPFSPGFVGRFANQARLSDAGLTRDDDERRDSISSARTSGMKGRESKVPSVTMSTANVQGDLDKNIIRRYIRQKLPQIQYCYEKQLVVKQNLSGTVTTQFVISGTGAVISAKASGMGDSAVEE